jgi:cold shock CspA family protein
MLGTIKIYKSGYGFIDPVEGDSELFFHRSALPESEKNKKPKFIEGRTVEFEIGDRDGKPIALNLKFIDAAPANGARQ